MAFVGLFLALFELGLWVWNWGIFTPYLDLEYFGGLVLPMVITRGLLCYGLATRRSGFLTPWLLGSFIVIIRVAYNFGYVSN